MRKHLILFGGAIVSFLTIWSYLATIAPDTFQIQGKPLLAWLQNPITVGIAFTAGIIWLVFYLWSVEGRLENIEANPRSSRLEIVARTPEIVCVRLGEREFEFLRGAYEYYERLPDVDKEKILRLLRRYILKLRWTREDFIIEVDERQRVHIRLDRFIGQGKGLNDTIEEERTRRSIAPPPASSLADVLSGITVQGLPNLPGLPDFKLQQLGTDVQRWEDEVYGFLKGDLPGFAEEFRLPVEGPSGETDQLGLLAHRVERLVERLATIKRKAPV